MKLYKFHIGQASTSQSGHGHTVSGCYIGIGIVAEYLRGTASSKHGFACFEDVYLIACRIQHVGSPTGYSWDEAIVIRNVVLSNQVDSDSVFKDIDGGIF